jgi:hypothetical protein
MSEKPPTNIKSVSNGNTQEHPQASAEALDFITNFIAEINAGRVGFGFAGKIGKGGKDFVTKDGRVFKPTGEYGLIESVANRHGLQSILTNTFYGMGDPNLIIDRAREHPIASMILVLPISLQKTEGTTTEKYTETAKGFLGRQKKVLRTREIPNKIMRPASLSELTIHGSQEQAYMVSYSTISHGADKGGRPYINNFVFIVSKKEVERIFGTQEKPGGLLKDNPNLLIQMIKAEAPGLFESSDSRVSGSPIRTLVVANNFSPATFDGASFPQLAGRLDSGELADNILEYKF